MRKLLFISTLSLVLLAIGCVFGVKGPVSEQTNNTPSASPVSEMTSTTQATAESPNVPDIAPEVAPSTASSVQSEKALVENTLGDAPDVAVAEQRMRVIALDPGHGGPEVGAAAHGLAEKDVNLKIALKLAELLRAEGYRVVLTREKDEATSPEYKGGSYGGGLGYDLQARVDIANAAQADIFISIHNNGSGDPNESGTEVWYNSQRSFADRNRTLAKLVQQSLLERLQAIGYSARDRGIKDDSNFRIFRGRAFNIYVLGPGTGARPHVPTQMPGVLGESLFVSNPRDAAMLRQERTLDAIAAGYRDAVVTYFELHLD